MPQASQKTRLTASNPESEWFGFRRVKPDEKTGMVSRVFASVAGNYDVMNDLMSGGLHRLWKDTLVSRINPKLGQALLWDRRYRITLPQEDRSPIAARTEGTAGAER